MDLPVSKVETMTGVLDLPSLCVACISPVKAVTTTEYLVNAFKLETSRILLSSSVLTNEALYSSVSTCTKQRSYLLNKAAIF